MIRESRPQTNIENISVENFRPNLVVGSLSGMPCADEPHMEDGWKSLSLSLHGSSGTNVRINMQVVGPCSRCSMVDVNGRSGIMDCRVFEALKDYRKLGSSVYFGQFLSVLPSIWDATTSENEIYYISVGDRIQVTQQV
jgi:uncharacterized protein YcbX